MQWPAVWRHTHRHDSAHAVRLLDVVIDGHNDLAWAMRQRCDYDLSMVDLSQSVPGIHTDEGIAMRCKVFSIARPALSPSDTG